MVVANFDNMVLKVFKYFGKKKVSENTHQHTYTSTWIWETGKKEIKCTQRWWRAIHNSLCKLCFINVQWLSITAIWSATYYFNILAQYAMFWTTQSSETSQLLWEKVQWNATWSSHFVQLPLELHYHFTGGQLSDVAQQWQHPWGGGRMYLLTAVWAFGEWTEYYGIFQI